MDINSSIKYKDDHVGDVIITIKERLNDPACIAIPLVIVNVVSDYDIISILYERCKSE